MYILVKLSKTKEDQRPANRVVLKSTRVKVRIRKFQPWPKTESTRAWGIRQFKTCNFSN